MKFALLTHLPRPEGTDPSVIIAETIEQVKHSEELGFYLFGKLGEPTGQRHT